MTMAATESHSPSEVPSFVRLSVYGPTYENRLSAILRNWTFLQDEVLRRSWQTKINKLKDIIVSFFTTNSDPNSRDLLSKLVKPIDDLYASFVPFTKVAEDLLTIRQGCFFLDNGHEAFSTEKLEECIDVYLSNFSEISLANFQSCGTDLLWCCGVITFFAINTEPNSDDVAMMLSEEIGTRFEIAVELDQCKQVAQELLTWRQDYLNNKHNNTESLG